MQNSIAENRCEELLTHAGWVRGLARSLVFDQERVDDVVQETWAVALRKQGEGIENVRAWLGGIVRHTARQLGRSEQARTRRERASEAREDVRSAAEVVEHAELQREVVTAVLALEEPYRSTILFRFFNDESPQSIASRLGIPGATVRTRLKRGLELLRERLDEDADGDRRAWSLQMIPMILSGDALRTGVGLTTLITGGLGMTWITKLAVGISVAFFAVMLWMNRSEDAVEPESGTEVAAAEPERVMPDEEEVRPEERGAAEIPAEAATLTRAAVVVEKPEEEPPVELAKVTGRFRFPEGAPAAGIPVKLLEIAPGGFPDSTSPCATGTSDAGGEFSLRFDAVPDYQYFFTAQPEGFVTVSDLVDSRRPDAVVDFGAITLIPAGVIEGSIIDEVGRPLSNRWRVQGRSSVAATWGTRGLISLFAHVDRDTGTYRFEGVPEGVFQVELNTPRGENRARVDVAVVAGEATRHDFVLAAEPEPREISLSISYAPSARGIEGEPVVVELHGAGGAVRRKEWDPVGTNRLTFGNLEPGTYDVSLDDPRFAPWTASGVRLGEFLSVDLVGSSALRVRVEDAETGAAIEEYALDAHVPAHAFWERVIALRGPQQPAPEGGVYDGLVASSMHLQVIVPGYEETTYAVAGGLQPGETRAVVVAMRKGYSIHGVVTHADGRPAAGVDIVAEPMQLDVLERIALRNQESLAPRRPQVRTDEAGRFRVDGLQHRPYRVRAGEVPFPGVMVEGLAVGEGEEDALVRLVLPEVGVLVGRLEGAGEHDFTGLRLEVGPPAGSEALAAVLVDLESDGSFRVEPLPLGTLTVSLVTPEVPAMMGSSFRRTTGGSRHFLGEVTIVAGVTECDFDAHAFVPGTAAFHVSIDGDPAGGAFVLMQRVDDEGSPDGIDAGGTCAGDGTLRVGCVPPGTWRIQVRPFTVDWCYVLPELLEIAPEETRALDVPIVTAAGSIRVLDEATGAPLANRTVCLLTTEPRTTIFARELKTDEQGRLALQLPPGAHRLACFEPFAIGLRVTEQDCTLFEWSELGPVGEDVVLSIRTWQ